MRHHTHTVMGCWIFYRNSKFLNRFHRMEGTLSTYCMKRSTADCHGHGGGLHHAESERSCQRFGRRGIKRSKYGMGKVTEQPVAYWFCIYVNNGGNRYNEKEFSNVFCPFCMQHIGVDNDQVVFADRQFRIFCNRWGKYGPCYQISA